MGPKEHDLTKVGSFGIPEGSGHGLKEKISENFDIWRYVLSVEDHFLLDEDLQNLLQSDMKFVRVWLRSVMIARGEMRRLDEVAHSSYGLQEYFNSY